AVEIATLVAALDRAIAGQGSVVAVLAEAGAGKSRIASELATEATARHVSVLTGRAYESEQILAFGPWVDALRAARLAADTRVVGTGRAEEVDDAPALRAAFDELDRDGRLTSVPLRPLSRSDTHELARALARTGSDETVLAGLADHAWTISEGNPFVVVETVL